MDKQFQPWFSVGHVGHNYVRYMDAWFIFIKEIACVTSVLRNAANISSCFLRTIQNSEGQKLVNFFFET